MTDSDLAPEPPTTEAAPARTDMTIAEVRQWLRQWVASATGRSPDVIDEATPMVELGLSSRDAVAMAADIEDHTGITVSIAAAFEHPTIESLATWIVEGDPDLGSTDDDETDWTRPGPVERVDIA
ncbi:MAG TPA: acyl carrier protein, partial [Mycobacteriales bacterium]|nr:acyl carrier protein [Mycobacteriales bacterium]